MLKKVLKSHNIEYVFLGAELWRDMGGQKSVIELPAKFYLLFVTVSTE
jgi:hypothetical protein